MIFFIAFGCIYDDVELDQKTIASNEGNCIDESMTQLNFPIETLKCKGI